MKMPSKAGIMALATAVAAVAYAKDQYVTGVADIADAVIDADTTQVYFNTTDKDSELTYKLSDDTTIPCGAGVPGGKTHFDFSDGNHTLSVNGIKWLSMRDDTELYFTGGAWNFMAKAVFYLGRYSDANYSRQKVVVDGASLTNISQFIVGGRDTTLLLTNCAIIATSKDNGINLASPGDVNSTSCTNVNVMITRGSKFHSWSTTYTDGTAAGGTTPTGNKVLVTGEGSYLGQAPGRTQRLYHGNKTSGNFVRYENRATAKFYETFVGMSANSKSNILQIADGAAYTNTNPCAIGTAAGADYNRIEVLNGGEFNENVAHLIEVGRTGSYNELLVSNGIISNAKAIQVGTSTGATGNRVHVIGRSAKISFLGEFPMLFGSGQGNEWVLDNCYIDGKLSPIPGQGAKDWRLRFSGLSDSENQNASTNNTFRMENSAYLRVYEFNYPVATEGNLAVVGNCSTLDVSRAASIRGHGNVLAVSNGVMRLFDVTLGSSGENTTEFTESGNVLAFQGKTPLLTTFDGTSRSLNVYDGGILRFEIPSDGYDTAEPIPLRTFNTFIYNGTLEFPGLEEYTRNMAAKEATYQLTNAGFRMYASDGTTENGTEQLEAVSATLPAGCRVYRNNSLHLYLHVRRASKGTAIVVR